MPNQKPQAISGVSASVENVIRIEYPSIASTGLGKMLGSLYNSMPLQLGTVKLSYLLFPLPTAPLGLIPYTLLKLAGQRYILTNRSMQKWASLGNRLLSQVALSQVAEVLVEQLPGQEFYKAADLELLAADGTPLMRLEGVKRAEVFRQSILEARDALLQVESSLATIQARQPA